MKKQFKVLASALTVLLVSAALVGCGKKVETPAPVAETKKESKEITIWSQYQGKDFAPIKQMSEDWAKATGNTVKVVEDKGGFDSIVAASKSSKGPDVVIGVANDHMGALTKAGIVEAVPSGVMSDSDYITPALTAVTVDGKKMGVPLTLETYALFYNKDLVPTPPKTYDEMVEMAKKVGFNYELNNFYFSLALIQGYGGYVFKNNAGTLDLNDIGLNNEGAVKGLTAINELANSGLVSPSVTGDIAKGNFQNKKVGLYISGPWDVSGFKDAKLNFGVAPYPTIDGKPAPTEAGVKVAVVSSTSKNKDTAWDFMKYLGAKGPMVLFKNTAAIPVLKADQAKEEVKNDPISTIFAKQSESAVPMPVAPEFGQVWDPAKNNITLMITKKQTPKQAADNLVKQFKEKIQGMK